MRPFHPMETTLADVRASMQAWRLANPEKYRLAKKRADRLRRGVTKAIRAAVLKRDKGLCHICGNPPAKIHFDHAVPVAMGGTNDIWNVRVSCAPCNLKKGANGDMPEQADHHDGPCTVKDCQRCRAERAEARIAELEAEIARWEDRTNP